MLRSSRFTPFRYSGIVSCLCLSLVAAMASPTAETQEQGKRVALIVGNNDYSISPLKNAVNDARLMDKALKAAGFKTILRENVTQTAFQEATAEFLQQLGPDDTALFFYAGHGIQIENENFLVPVDFEAATSVIQAKFRCFSMALLLDSLKNRPKRSIIVLDACRSNPVAQAQSLQAGLAQPQNAGKETYIAFSTAPGQVAADNPDGRNSWFTEALTDLLATPGLTIQEVFTRVSSRVSSDTEGRQTPWIVSTLTNTFYFHPPLNADSEHDPSLAEKWMLEAQVSEHRQDWADAIGLVEQVLKRKPGGDLESAATAKLPYLKALKDAQERYAASDFGSAASLFDKALNLDPFSIDAAFEAIDSYLLNDQLPEAVRLLEAVRVRGTTASIEKANAMLKELAAVDPKANEVLQAGIPQPAPIQELFKGIQFGTPDLYAGQRHVKASPVQLSRWIKELEAVPPTQVVSPVEVAGGASGPPPVASDDNSTASQIAKNVFHVEISSIGDSRDLVIHRIGSEGSAAGSDSPVPLGHLLLDGPPGQLPVILNGKAVAQQVPYDLTLPIGKYQVSTMKEGQVVVQTNVQVTQTDKPKFFVGRQ